MKEYLGDGLYVDYDGHMVILTAEDGVSIQNEVFLEPQVLVAFEDFLRRLRADFRRSMSKENSDNST
jgi:hypothetical protein